MHFVERLLAGKVDTGWYQKIEKSEFQLEDEVLWFLLFSAFQCFLRKLDVFIDLWLDESYFEPRLTLPSKNDSLLHRSIGYPLYKS